MRHITLPEQFYLSLVRCGYNEFLMLPPPRDLRTLESILIHAQMDLQQEFGDVIGRQTGNHQIVFVGQDHHNHGDRYCEARAQIDEANRVGGVVILEAEGWLYYNPRYSSALLERVDRATNCAVITEYELYYAGIRNSRPQHGRGIDLSRQERSLVLSAYFTHLMMTNSNSRIVCIIGNNHLDEMQQMLGSFLGYFNYPWPFALVPIPTSRPIAYTLDSPVALRHSPSPTNSPVELGSIFDSSDDGDDTIAKPSPKPDEGTENHSSDESPEEGPVETEKNETQFHFTFQ